MEFIELHWRSIGLALISPMPPVSQLLSNNPKSGLSPYLELSFAMTYLHSELLACLVLEWDWLVLRPSPSFSPAVSAVPQTVPVSLSWRRKTFSSAAPLNSPSLANTRGAAAPQISSSGLVILQELGGQDQGRVQSRTKLLKWSLQQRLKAVSQRENFDLYCGNSFSIKRGPLVKPI